MSVTWDTVLTAPAFILNLERRPDRWDAAVANVERAGFRDIQRYAAVDARDSATCATAYAALGSPKRHPSFNRDFDRFPGTWGVFLSQVSLWKKIVDENIPIATIFEDDVVFHTQWDTLAPTYYAHTPMDWDVLFLGSQLEFASKYPIDRGPVFCLHAYTVTQSGAKKLLDYVTSPYPGGIYTIDTMLKVAMEQCRPPPFQWYVWNGTFFPCPLREAQSVHWKKRNSGLVYQDERLGTDIREYESK
jgi:GR25 family glycosyltransferase involved in LPS biosynthesis